MSTAANWRPKDWVTQRHRNWFSCYISPLYLVFTRVWSFKSRQSTRELLENTSTDGQWNDRWVLFLRWFVMLGVWKLHTWVARFSIFVQTIVWKGTSLFLPPPSPIQMQNCRWINQILNRYKLNAPRSETRFLEFELYFDSGLSWIKSREIYSINSNGILCATRFASMYENDGLPWAK